MASDAAARTRARFEVGQLWARRWWTVAWVVVDAAVTSFIAVLMQDCPIGILVSSVAVAALLVPAVMSVGAFLVLIPDAVRRQRNEARDELRSSKRTPEDDPASLAEAFSAFVAKTNAIAPPTTSPMLTAFLKDEQRRLASERHAEASRIRRSGVREYYDRFRGPVLALLLASGPDFDEAAEQAREPDQFSQIAALVDVVKRAAKRRVEAEAGDERAVLREGSPIGPSPWPRSPLERAILTSLAAADKIMREAEVRGDEGFLDRVVEWAGNTGQRLEQAEAGALLNEFADEGMPSTSARDARFYLDKQRRRLRRALRTVRRDEHSALDLLKERYSSGRELQERLPYRDGVASTPEELAEAAESAKRDVCEWAEETWEVLNEDFKGHEREFYGPGDRSGGKVFFLLSCQEEMERGSVDAYLERKLDFIADLIRKYDR